MPRPVLLEDSTSRKRSLHPSAILEPKSRKVPEPSSGVGGDPKHQHNAGHSVAAICMFRAVLRGLGDFSALNVQLRTAVHADDHVRRILSGFAASTVVRYVGAWNSLLQTIQDLGHSLACLTEPLLADCLVAASLSKHADTCSGCCATTAIKALRWLCRVAQVELLEIAHAPFIDSFLKSKIPRDRKEAYPLPQCVLHHWERRILDRRSSQSEVLTLGGFLMTAWASLRFADAQRVEFSSLFLDADALRGICYATKTSFLGQPFGVIRGGLLSTGSHDWICTYLRALDDVCCRQVGTFRPISILLFYCWRGMRMGRYPSPCEQ